MEGKGNRQPYINNVIQKKKDIKREKEEKRDRAIESVLSITITTTVITIPPFLFPLVTSQWYQFNNACNIREISVTCNFRHL